MKKEAILESKCILDQTEGSMVNYGGTYSTFAIAEKSGSFLDKKKRYVFVFNSLPREQVCRLTRPLEADYGIGELAGQTLRLPAKGFQILHERREG